MIRNFCYNCFKNLVTIKKDETDKFIRAVSICDYCSREGKIKYIIEYCSKNEKGLITEETEAFEKSIRENEDLSELTRKYIEGKKD